MPEIDNVLLSSIPSTIDPKNGDFGAKGDTRFVLDAVTNGTNVVSSATAAFTPQDVGKLYDIFVFATASSIAVSGVITGYISPTQVQIDTTVAGGTGRCFVFGTDDTVAIQNFINGVGPRSPYVGQKNLNFGNYFVTAALTVAPDAGLSIDGPGTIWFSSRLGAANGLSWADTKGSTSDKFNRVNFISSSGHTGRQINAVCTPENQNVKYFRQCVLTHLSLTHDYQMYGDGAQPYLEDSSIFCGAGTPGAKMYGCNCPASEVVIRDSQLIGRAFFNCQQVVVKGSAIGSQRLGNNSKRDNTGTSQQTNIVRYDSCYIYESAGALGDFRLIASVVVSTAGEGAEGGAMPTVVMDNCYCVVGGMSTATQIDILGNFSVSQGSTSFIAIGTTFVQSAASPATNETLISSSGGAPFIWFGPGSAWNILSTTTTAVIGTKSAGNAEISVADFMPSGQATFLQHPTVSGLVSTLTAWPAASGVGARNIGATSYDIWLTAVSAITAIAISADNTTYVTLWSGAGTTVVPYVFRWPAGTWLKITYATTAPNYILVPCT